MLFGWDIRPHISCNSCGSVYSKGKLQFICSLYRRVTKSCPPVMQRSKWSYLNSTAARICSSPGWLDPCWLPTTSRSCSCRCLMTVCCCTTAIQPTAPATFSRWLCVTASSSTASISALDQPSFGNFQTVLTGFVLAMQSTTSLWSLITYS